MTLIPPVLPPFLAGAYDLKPVEGVPSDEEVKVVHAVVRALNDVVNVPALYNAHLAMRLSMHLFSIQMACYRDKHPCTIFPTSTTHTPPQLPAHIPVELEPVTGPPSDEQIKSVQTALRLYESMANIPSMFDADLSMKLSQHLFDIQFERYLRQVADEALSGPVMSSRARAQSIIASDHDDADHPSVQNEPMEQGREQGDHGAAIVETIASSPIHEPAEARSRDRVSRAARNTAELLEPIRPESIQVSVELLKLGLEDTNKVLAEVKDGLKDLRQVMIVAQQSMARGLNRTHNWSGWCAAHALLNANGEEPYTLGLPSILDVLHQVATGKQVADCDLAWCLRFYGLGGEYIEDGDEPTIKQGNKDAAMATLNSYIGI